MNRLALLALLPLITAAPAFAQPMDPNMPGMTMPMASTKPHTKPKKAHSPSGRAQTMTRRAKPRLAKPVVNAAHSRQASSKGAPGLTMTGMDMSKPMSGGQAMGSMPGMVMSTGHPKPDAMAGMAGMSHGGTAPAAAQQQDMAHMPGMTPAPAGPSTMADMPGMKGMAMAKGAMTEGEEADIPRSPPPPPALDHAADRYFDPSAMAAARAELRKEHGGSTVSMVMANLAEYQSRSGGGGYRWDGQAWIGGDINRFVVKSEGSGSRRGGVEEAEVQGLYSRAIDPYFDLQAGVREDFAPHGRTYVTLGVQGLAPYWFDVSGAVFLSTKGEVLARFESTYDLRLTQRWILQPRAELNFAAQNTAETRTGSGLSNAELGLRLRYEIKREFAPYVGVSWDRKVGKTADYARARGEDVGGVTFVAGIRAWF